MIDDNIERMLHSQRRMRLFYRKLGGIILHYFPIIAALFILITATIRTLLAYDGAFYHCKEPLAIDLVFYVNLAIVVLLLYFYLLTSSVYLGFCRLHRVVITYDLIGCLVLEYSMSPGYGCSCLLYFGPIIIFGIILFCKYIHHRYVKRRNAYYPGLPDHADAGVNP